MASIEAADPQGVPVYLQASSDGKSASDPARMVHELYEPDKKVVSDTQTNAATTLTITPTSGKKADVLEVCFGYSGIPTGAGLQIASTGQPTRQLPITNSGPGQIMAPITGAVDAVVTITMSAGGAGIVGYLSASYRNK